MEKKDSLQIVSDLHLEFLQNPPIKKTGTFLALLGDICCVADPEDQAILLSFLKLVCKHYKFVFFVAGNHEFYYKENQVNNCDFQNTMQGCINTLTAIAKILPNFRFLNNNSVTITANGKKYMIIGSTLWTFIPKESGPKIQDLMNDYRKIYIADEKTRKFTPADATNLHINCYKYIASRIREAKKQGIKAIVLTHHKPYLKEEDKKDDRYVCYGSDCTKLFGDPVYLWAYGHTHVADNSVIKGTKVYSNPKGYPKQKTLYNPSKTINL
jgi:predicted MPP superfamily phosphohydrolase